MMMLLALACSTRPQPADAGPSSDSTTPSIVEDTAHTSVVGTADTGPTGMTAHTGDAGGLPPYAGPFLLSDTELYADLAADVLADGVLSTTPQYPLWTDGAEKRRFLWVPPGESIDTTDPDHWVFPTGTVAFKEFVRDGVRVETRRFAKDAEGWSFVSYVWRPDGSDAEAAPDGVDDALGTPHDVPSREQCAFCHVGPADLFLGISAFQLDAEQQAALPLTAPVEAVVPGQGGVQAALGYLHGNCGHCHREGTLPADRSGLLLDLSVEDVDPDQVHAVTSGIDKRAKHAIAGTETVIVRGNPAASQLWVRMDLPGFNQMPPSGSETPDPDGLSLIEAWILGL